MIPRVLKSTIMEVVNGRETALDELIDYSLRTYLLVHQVLHNNNNNNKNKNNNNNNNNKNKQQQQQQQQQQS